MKQKDTVWLKTRDYSAHSLDLSDSIESVSLIIFELFHNSENYRKLI